MDYRTPNEKPPAAVSPLAPLAAAVRAAQARHTLFPHLDFPTAGQSVVVGVSGGADSVALLVTLRLLAEEWRLSLHVAHLDHGLRPESAADAQWVAALARRLGLPFHLHHIAPGALHDAPGGVEAAARRSRYAFLCDLARTVTGDDANPAVIAVAHHRDDQAETVLMNLIRGSGVAGLAAMAPITRLRMPPDRLSDRLSVRVVRPFLAVAGDEIRACLRETDLGWCEDASNADPRHLRNAIRHTVMPLLAQFNPDIAATLARNAEILGGELVRLDALDRAALQASLVQSAPHFPMIELQAAACTERLVLDLERFQAQDRATRRGMLRQVLACFGVDRRDAGSLAIERLLEESEQIRRQEPAGLGPQPWIGGVDWTYFPARHGAAPMLSLHRTGALPWLPDHPYLLPDAAKDAGTIPLRAPGLTRVNAVWSLDARRLARADLPADWPACVSPWEAYLDAQRVDELYLTTPADGMRIAPLGMQGHTKSVGDLFTDAKIHPTLRAGWPIVLAHTPGNAPFVAWVCGLALSEQVRIHPATQNILHIRWRITK